MLFVGFSRYPCFLHSGGVWFFDSLVLGTTVALMLLIWCSDPRQMNTLELTLIPVFHSSLPDSFTPAFMKEI